MKDIWARELFKIDVACYQLELSKWNSIGIRKRFHLKLLVCRSSVQKRYLFLEKLVLTSFVVPSLGGPITNLPLSCANMYLWSASSIHRFPLICPNLDTTHQPSKRRKVQIYKRSWLHILITWQHMRQL